MSDGVSGVVAFGLLLLLGVLTGAAAGFLVARLLLRAVGWLVT